MSTVLGWLLGCFAWAFYFLPRGLQIRAGNGLGFVLRKAGMREKIVRQNLDYAFPNRPEEQEKVFQESYRHLGNLLLEILFVFGPIYRFVERYGNVKGIENWRKASAKGNGVIFLASHVGNWEVMAVSAPVCVPGCSLMIVTKHLKPEWFHQLVEACRKRTGVEATYEPKTLRDVMKHLKAGRTVAIVLDQYAGPPIGVRVPVFGKPVGTTGAVAMLAKRTGAPVLPVVSYRLPDGRYQMEIRPEVEWEQSSKEDPSYDIGHNTARYAAALEKDIYAHSGQWLWTHRRFKGDLTPLRDGEWSEGRARH